MALIDMRQTAEEAGEYAGGPEPADAPQYPYGLCINLDEDSLAKLGITTLPAVGSTIVVQCVCVVQSASQYQTMGGEPEANSSWQITMMQILGQDKQGDAASALYDGNRGSTEYPNG